MYIIRPARQSDLSAIERCALAAGLGMTHLPRRRDILEKRIQASIHSFAKEVNEPIDEEYLFVLENTENKTVIGTCAIYSKTGAFNPFYVYEIEEVSPTSERLPPIDDPRLLRLIPIFHGPSEVAALFILPEYRKEGLGKLLSLSRFHFIASHMQRFDRMTIANMRGIIENNISPFWEGLGRRFLNVELQEVMSMRLENDLLVTDILPPQPIYVTLLPPSVQNVIGAVHPNTVPALRMLNNEGFHFDKQIDPVDGGPILITETSKIKTIRESQTASITEIVPELQIDKPCLISNISIDFRACFGPLRIQDHSLIISADTAKALQVQVGDTIRFNKNDNTKQ
jgi:arginine N-succinyltransferase